MTIKQKSKFQRQNYNENGQVAIFVALIFQVLFVFFAMLINVGLLVHHKINLQNSVDIAAYYGATKQAEVMNVIAHLNFQIRQSMKLMTFRYRHLGSFGYNQYPGSPTNDIETNEDSKVFPQFCNLYVPFEYMNFNRAENYCQKSGLQTPFTITLPPRPASGGASLFGFNDIFVQAIDAARNAIVTDCRQKRSLSVFTLLMFIRGHKLDVGQRKMLAVKLARRISEPIETMNDLNNESIKTGIENTLKKNLTYQNKDKVEIEIFNSLSGQKCGNVGDEDTPPKWLVEKFYWPIYWSFLADCEGNPEQTTYKGAPISILDDLKNDPKYAAAINSILGDKDLGKTIQDLYEFIIEPDGTIAKNNYYKSTSGFEKNPWCMGYVAVKAKAKPKIPFALPFGEVELVARAYAKPFGGTIGPWAKSRWDASSNFSNGGEDVEKVSPFRVQPGQLLDNTLANDPRTVIDYARYVGDEIGTKSNLTMNNYYKVFQQFRKEANSLSLKFWGNLFDPKDDLYTPGTNGDYLAWDQQNPTNENALKMRNLELSVITPDQFDVAYYSVEPDYYRNYYLRLIKPQQGFKFPVRGDLGMQHKPGVAVAPWDRFSVKEQMKKVVEEVQLLDFRNKLTYVPLAFPELLTSYKAAAPDNLIMDTDKNFGKCTTPIKDDQPEEKATTGNCLIGGRVGYSVKIVDGDFLTKEQELGGTGVRGAILNPVPQGF